ncbi:MAG: aldo/keto reductase [Actinomycetota bacterium]|nr:aldo/keto reductase [Actinomycetota bacterium]
MLPRLPFGRTGHHSTRLIFGAAALGGMSQARADRTLAQVLAVGINHIDTAASYGNAEVRLHDFLADHRSEFFLATKTGERDGAAARRELEQSLQRMGVQQVDLIQLHNLVEPDEWEAAHAPGGAVEALVQARDEGLVRFIGVTGHGTRIPAMHLRSLDRFPYDSVLFPYNFTMMSDPVYSATVEELIDVCATRGAAVQTIKSVARRRWPAGSTEPHFSWYEPLPAGDALRRAVAYVLARPGLFLNTSSDGRLLGAIVDAVGDGAIAAPPAEQMAADAAELDISPLFDGAALERI